MNKNLYLIVFIGFLAISFFVYINQNNILVSQHKNNTNDTIKPLTKEDIMGKYGSYSFNDFCGLHLYKDTFYSESGSCTLQIQENGKWNYQNNTLYFSDVYGKSQDDIFLYFSKKENQEYIIMRQDSFLILINKSWDSNYLSKIYKEICRLHNAGLNATHSTFLHKKLENHTPVPIPTIPTEYHKFLLKKQINCQVIAINNDTILTLNVGRKDGVFEKLILSKLFFSETPKKQERFLGRRDMIEFLKVEIIECNDSTSKAQITHKRDFWEYDFQTFVPNIKKLKVGDTLHSYYEKPNH